MSSRGYSKKDISCNCPNALFLLVILINKKSDLNPLNVSVEQVKPEKSMTPVKREGEIQDFQTDISTVPREKKLRKILRRIGEEDLRGDKSRLYRC
ncbi:MAG: hypothetical protein D3903_14385 [Candidatus Electrothrix sp. GM3_4]|nr:hypothetical protein [Candidatus Electrothrix sp. GM3_4]